MLKSCCFYPSTFHVLSLHTMLQYLLSVLPLSQESQSTFTILTMISSQKVLMLHSKPNIDKLF
jgi:hypothetical protein